MTKAPLARKELTMYCTVILEEISTFKKNIKVTNLNFPQCLGTRGGSSRRPSCGPQEDIMFLVLLVILDDIFQNV